MHSSRQAEPSTTDVSKSAVFFKLLRHQVFENYPSLTKTFWQNGIIERGRSPPPHVRGEACVPPVHPSHGWWWMSWGRPRMHYPRHREPLTRVRWGRFYSSIHFTKACGLVTGHGSAPNRCRVGDLGLPGPGAAPGGDGCFQLLTPQPRLCTLSAFWNVDPNNPFLQKR